jgi:hypothetical protein
MESRVRAKKKDDDHGTSREDQQHKKESDGYGQTGKSARGTATSDFSGDTARQ